MLIKIGNWEDDGTKCAEVFCKCMCVPHFVVCFFAFLLLFSSSIGICVAFSTICSSSSCLARANLHSACMADEKDEEEAEDAIAAADDGGNANDSKPPPPAAAGFPTAIIVVALPTWFCCSGELAFVGSEMAATASWQKKGMTFVDDWVQYVKQQKQQFVLLSAWKCAIK